MYYSSDFCLLPVVQWFVNCCYRQSLTGQHYSGFQDNMLANNRKRYERTIRFLGSATTGVLHTDSITTHFTFINKLSCSRARLPPPSCVNSSVCITFKYLQLSVLNISVWHGKYLRCHYTYLRDMLYITVFILLPHS